VLFSKLDEERTTLTKNIDLRREFFSVFSFQNFQDYSPMSWISFFFSTQDERIQGTLDVD